MQNYHLFKIMFKQLYIELQLLGKSIKTHFYANFSMTMFYFYIVIRAVVIEIFSRY